MKTLHLIATIGALGLALPVHAAGNADAGKADYKKCAACHAIIDDAGTVIQKGGKTGPNLYGVVGRPVASADFNYGDSILQAGAKGLVWDEAMIAAYIADPTAWLRQADVTGDAKARSKMSYKLAKGGEDMAAYLASVKP